MTHRVVWSPNGTLKPWKGDKRCSHTLINSGGDSYTGSILCYRCIVDFMNDCVALTPFAFSGFPEDQGRSESDDTIPYSNSYAEGCLKL